MSRLINELMADDRSVSEDRDRATFGIIGLRSRNDDRHTSEPV